MQKFFSCRSSRTDLKEFHVAPVGKWSIGSRYLPTSGFCNVYNVIMVLDHLHDNIV